MKTEQRSADPLVSAVTARLSPAGRLLSRTAGRLVVRMHSADASAYRSPAIARLFTNPYTRRELYREAHSDTALSARIKASDPFYAERSQLSPLQKNVRRLSERILFVPLAAVEGLVGGPLDVIEHRFFNGRRTLAGRLFDDFMYVFSDMFHGKRLLYTLP